MALVNYNDKLDKPYSIEEEYEDNVWWDAMKTCSNPIV
jgi:hypothetical protein